MKNFIYILLLIVSSNIHTQSRIIITPSDNVVKILEGAPEGSTIIFKSGIYKVNNIRINKSLSIEGENYPVLQGNKKR